MQKDAFKEIHEQIHEIRNFLGPLDIKLENLDSQITGIRLAFESRASDFETKLASSSLRISDQAVKLEEHSDEIFRLSERIRRIELTLNLPSNVDKLSRLPVHEDKASPTVPTILPPENPPK